MTMPPSNGTLRVGYILKMFPRLSETFILNELLELERQDVELSVFSLMHPNDGRFHGRLADLRAKADYFPADRAEHHWDIIKGIPDSERIPIWGWRKAAEFLRRHSIPRDLELLLRAVRIAAMVRRRKIAHLHAHFATVATRVAGLVHLLTGVPFSFTAHAKDVFRETVDLALFTELAHLATFSVTVSDFNRDFIMRNMPGLKPDKLLRLYNGVDLRFFSPPTARTSTGPPHIVSIGRLVPKKGFGHLLRALSLCKRRGLPFRATIVGDGEQQTSLLALRDELDLKDEVMFPGALPQEQVRGLLEQATVVALACVPDADGNMDALPTVLLESLALDRPIVSTRLTGIPEIVGDEAGILVEPQDDAGLAAAVEEMCRRVRSGRYASGVGRARAERLFDLRTNVSLLRHWFANSGSGVGP